ncbi:hypothetical protein CCOS865_00924 [Pseudomonas reidholzensis]|uniref:Nucleotidyl transferase AbiEii/AbiGii toxin family protein n=1 Tax=Pseudomonas reidholzensis TaxID=1785162 RepID=A0A383RP80_9PSED|nr:hypothetical protein [Pseudomonas reidholzensis]SYX88685.1 hypothetical protein CCOS865_00924 [Pseudomonas reidholzensis]
MAEVRGLAHFGRYFSEHRHRYVLIGGVAASLTMEDAGETFRTTKDLDIVLVIEALNNAFFATFWEYIKSGGYRIKQSSIGRPVFYRFQHPSDEAYPVQIELFSRATESLEHPENATLTPIPTDEALSSLSAILLDDAYYNFLLGGRQQNQLHCYIGADRLIPFKAKAWLDLSTRQQAGEKIDARNIRKHRNDVLALTGLLTSDPVELPDRITEDMKVFLELLEGENVNLKDLGLSGELAGIVERLKNTFRLQ